MNAYRVKATFRDGTQRKWVAIAPSSTCAAIAALKSVRGMASVFVEPKR
ncbi:hypothetical protein HPT27_10465 [Permianibacter sp. IMCC34836]|nr:hypothetical protein [Permianibacter fluminis]NQD37451.1 hypothetical protein [Permianibacter fluminis]